MILKIEFTSTKFDETFFFLSRLILSSNFGTQLWPFWSFLLKKLWLLYVILLVIYTTFLIPQQENKTKHTKLCENTRISVFGTQDWKQMRYITTFCSYEIKVTPRTKKSYSHGQKKKNSYFVSVKKKNNILSFLLV